MHRDDAYIIVAARKGHGVSIEFGKKLYGAGRFYVPVTVDVPCGGSVRALSSTVTGLKVIVPIVRARKADESQFVAIVPAFQVPQTVDVEVLADNGAVVSSAKTTVEPFSSAVMSRANAWFSGADYGFARYADLSPMEDSTLVKVNRRVLFADGEDRYCQIQAIASMILPPHVDENVEFEIQLFDSMGKAIPYGRFIRLSREISGIGAGGTRALTVDFSFIMPNHVKEFYLWVIPACDGMPQGFDAVDWHMSLELEREYGRLIKNSGVKPTYHEWFVEHHRASGHELARQRQDQFDIEPLFSIIVPLYKTPVNYFKEMVDSVFFQTYGKWELVLVNASPDDQELRRAVERAMLADSRVKCVTLDSNLGITLNTNAGIRAASGEFACFFDHDDVLEPSILYEYVKGINAYPETDLLYCDEDKLRNGRYIDGFFKPDFDWDLLTAGNYVCHLLTVRLALLRKLGELPGKEYDGSQDHNLTMLVAERARNVYHARKVLYHWRIHPQSTAGGADAKPWTLESGRLAIQEHFDRIGVNAVVENAKGLPNQYDVHYVLPNPNPSVSIVLIAKTADGAKRCIEAIQERTQYDSYEIIVVGCGAHIDEDSYSGEVKIVDLAASAGINEARNKGASLASGELIAFVDEAIEVISPDWLSLMAGIALRKDVGCVGAKMLYRDDSIHHAGIGFSYGMPVYLAEYEPYHLGHYFNYARFPHAVSAVDADCLVVRNRLFSEVGEFDPSFESKYGDIEFCLRVRAAGFSVVVEQRALMYYNRFNREGNAAFRRFVSKNASKQALLLSESARIALKWPSYCGSADPYYNENLEPGSAHYELSSHQASWSNAKAVRG